MGPVVRDACFQFLGAGIACFVAALGAGCSASQPQTEEYVFSGSTMGTFYSVKVAAPPLSSEQARGIRACVETHLDAVAQAMSTYRPDSELSQFNAFGETTPFRVAPEVAQVFAKAVAVSAKTGGAFDVTVGPLVNAWGFGPQGEPEAEPSEEELAALRRRVGYDKLEVDTVASTIAKSAPDVYCDLSAIAKGYAVDKLAEGLDALGFGNYMVEVGGEVRTRGRNSSGDVWRIGIARPIPGVGDVQRVIALPDLALATSGDYQNYYERDGKRLSHMIDPVTGRPIAHKLASVSVIHAECAIADAYATAFMVLGPDEGYTVAEELGLAALFIVRENSGVFVEKGTAAFEALASGDRDTVEPVEESVRGP